MRVSSALRPSILFWTLLSFPLLDELISGLPVIAMPLLRADLSLSYTQVGLIFTVGQVAALIFDPAINLMSDRHSKRGPVLGGMIGLVLGYALVASAPTYAVLLVAFGLITVAGGAAIGLAQATLIDRDVNNAPRTMTRWTTLAAVGDLLAPPAIAVAVAWNFGWRPLFWLAALLWLIMVLVVWPQRFPQPIALDTEGGQPAPGPIASLGAALRTPTLLRWLGIVLLCSMLDEIFLGFASLYLVDVVGLNAATTSMVLGGGMVGGLLGLIVLDRILKRISRSRLLFCMALLTLAGIIALLVARSLSIAAAAMFIIGLGASSWYPLAKAAAYETLPGRSGTVRAVDSLGAPFEIAVPLTVGLVAERFGISAGIALLGLAPIFVLLLLPRR